MVKRDSTFLRKQNEAKTLNKDSHFVRILFFRFFRYLSFCKGLSNDKSAHLIIAMRFWRIAKAIANFTQIYFPLITISKISSFCLIESSTERLFLSLDSIPPKTVCSPSKCGQSTKQMKNWLPPVSRPA